MLATRLLSILACSALLTALPGQIKNGDFEDDDGLRDWQTRGAIPGVGIAPTAGRGALFPALTTGFTEGTPAVRYAGLSQTFGCDGPNVNTFTCWVRATFRHGPGGTERAYMVLENGNTTITAALPVVQAANGADYKLGIPGCGETTVAFYRTKDPARATFEGFLLVDNVESTCVDSNDPAPWPNVTELPGTSCPSSSQGCAAWGVVKAGLALAAAETSFGTSCGPAPQLLLDADSRPVLGTAVGLTLDNIPAGTVIAGVLYGLTSYPAGQPLDGLGMPGCFAYLLQDASVLFLAPGTSATDTFLVPNDPSLAGLRVYAQGAAYCPGCGLNPLGAVTSHAIGLLINLF